MQTNNVLSYSLYPFDVFKQQVVTNSNILQCKRLRGLNGGGNDRLRQ